VESGKWIRHKKRVPVELAPFRAERF